MKLNLQITALSLGLALNIGAQTNNNNINRPKNRGCGTIVPSQEWNDAFNKKVEEYKLNLQSGRAPQANYTISVIFHIISGGQAVGTYPNISQAQVNSQFPVLNADYAGTGYGVNMLASTGFSTVGAANCNVYFCPALRNPNGQTLAEPGIDRINYNTMNWTNPGGISNMSTFQSYMDGTIKAQSIWDPNSYLNIWVTDAIVPLLGYATFPALAALSGLPGGGTATTDGVWLKANVVGNVGTIDPEYNLGRTASHEIGHYLGLRHIGGDANNVNGDCTATDYCNDTPPQKGGANGGQYGQNFGPLTYPLHANTCSCCAGGDPYGDMFMNFMDYSDDISLCNFTPNQASRVQTALATGFYRSNLTAASATLCSNPPAAPVAATLTMPTTLCDTSAAHVNNITTGNPIPTYSWSTIPAAGVSFAPSDTIANPSISFGAGQYTVICVATNSMGTSTTTVPVTVNACNVGIKTNSILKGFVSLQPNPSSGKVNVIASLPVSQNLEISVHTAIGQHVYSAKHSGVTNNVFELDLTALSNGVYFVTIDNGKEKVVKRLVLNK